MTLSRRIYSLKTPPVHEAIREALRAFYVEYHDSRRYRNDGTGDASGVVQLSKLVEGKQGLLNCIITRKPFDPSKALVQDNAQNEYMLGSLQYQIYKDSKYRTSLKEASHRFLRNRNLITHAEEYAYPDRVQKVTEDFLSIVEHYYTQYAPKTVQGIYDTSFYSLPLPRGFKFLDRFEIVQELGQDSLHRAYKAVDHGEPGKLTTALKVFFSDGKQDSSLFLQEQKSAGDLNDIQYVNRYIGSYPLGSDSMAIVRQYIEGEILEAWFDDSRRTPDFPYLVMCIAYTVLQALASIHRKGYVSGSITPRYIVVNRNMEGWLTEFSRTVKIGEVLPKIGDRDLTDYVPKRLPTKAFPELDTYMLGITLYRILTGNRGGELSGPFTAAKCPEVFRAYINEELVCFINKAVSINEKERFADGKAMLEAWDKAFIKLPMVNAGGRGMIRKIGLVSCARLKVETKEPIAARTLYSATPEFNQWVKVSEKVCSETYVISGRYGLVDLDQRLPEYDVDMRHFPPEGQAAWARFIVELLRVKGVDGTCEVHVFADGLYRSLIVGELQRYGITTQEYEWESMLQK